jgi:hypothetical protein
MTPPATPIRVSGGTWPATIWHAFSEPLLAGTPVKTFPVAEPVEVVEEVEEIDPDDLLLPIVPDVIGLPVQQAEAVLAEHGYAVRARLVDDPSRVPGTVSRSRPGRGTRLALGATVELDVAQGATLVTVPDLLGSLEEDARATGFEIEVVVELGGTGAPGVIWKQAPGGGEQVLEGTPIRIWVSPDEESQT